MKIWQGYGSEHSMNLVMIGHFKSSDDAEKTHKLIKQLSEGLDGKIELGSHRERFGDEVLELLHKTNCYNLSPSELEHFLYDIEIGVDGDKLILTTEEIDISAFFKLMINKGAKVEIFSAHDYPESEYGRGK